MSTEKEAVKEFEKKFQSRLQKMDALLTGTIETLFVVCKGPEETVKNKEPAGH